MTKKTANLLKKGSTTFTVGFAAGEVLRRTIDRCRETAEEREAEEFFNGKTPKTSLVRNLCEGAEKLSAIVGKNEKSDSR